MLIQSDIYQLLLIYTNDVAHECGELLMKAIHYAMGEWMAFIKCTTDGNYRVDNNATEQCMRDLAIGRKNFLFSGSGASAENLAFAYSLTQSCKFCQVNPYEYWNALLTDTNRADFNIDAHMPYFWHKQH